MKRCVKYKSTKGFTLIEVLLGFMIVSITMLMISSVCLGIYQTSKDPRLSDDALGIHQLRLLLAQSKRIKLQENCLTFDYQKETYTLSYQNHRIVRQKGYEIYLEKMDAVQFYEEGSCYGVSWLRQNKLEEAILWCESKRLH